MTDCAHILAVDVGNTRTKFGLFLPTPAGVSELPTCERFLAIPHEDVIPWNTLTRWTNQKRCRVSVAGSNPGRMSDLCQTFQEQNWTTPWMLTNRQEIPLEIEVDVPEKVGIDRLLNAVAVNVMRPASRPAIVIDTGTTATVDFVDVRGRFCGGAILPGFAMSAQALHAYTALLPLLTVRELANDPPIAVGRNTSDAIRSGIYWGHAGALQQVITQICRQQSLPVPKWDEPDSSDSQAPWLLLTGGGAPFLKPVFPAIPQVPSFALYGLVLAAQHRGIS